MYDQKVQKFIRRAREAAAIAPSRPKVDWKAQVRALFDLDVQHIDVTDPANAHLMADLDDEIFRLFGFTLSDVL